MKLQFDLTVCLPSDLEDDKELQARIAKLNPADDDEGGDLGSAEAQRAERPEAQYVDRKTRYKINLIWERFDVDKNGSLDKHEFKKFIEVVGDQLFDEELNAEIQKLL